MNVTLTKGRNVDGDTEYRTDDGYRVARIDGRNPWMVLRPDGSARYARNLDGARRIIAAHRSER